MLCLHLVRTMGSTCFLSRLRVLGASPEGWGGEWLYWEETNGQASAFTSSLGGRCRPDGTLTLGSSHSDLDPSAL